MLQLNNVPEPLAVARNATPEVGVSWSQERGKKTNTRTPVRTRRSLFGNSFKSYCSCFLGALALVPSDLCQTACLCVLSALDNIRAIRRRSATSNILTAFPFFSFNTLCLDGPCGLRPTKLTYPVLARTRSWSYLIF